VEVSYKLIGKNRYSFEVAKADPSLQLVIDPILQATYLGGDHSDEATALAIHPKTGEVYVAGNTMSTNFPRTAGGAQGINTGNSEVFVARLNKDLTQILQSTYLGGMGIDFAEALAIHPITGDVYVAGMTTSTDFPDTTGGAQADYGGGRWDAFVSRLSADLKQILQSTYLGGGKWDKVKALAIHPKTGEVYVAGYTDSTDFPRTSGGAQASKRGTADAFVARLNSSLTQILQSTYLGGSKEEESVEALAIHPKTGEVYVAGETDSTDFPRTSGGAQKDYGGGKYDTFVARLNSSLTQILQSTYLGGNDWDVAYALAIHPTTGEVYVAGYTFSTNFPRTTGGAQKDYGGGEKDAFVARLNSNLTQILQSTYLGGSKEDDAQAIAIHPTTGEVYVAGHTTSTDFPRTSGGAQGSYGGDPSDAFVARLNSSLTQILQSTYLGGNGADWAQALAIHPTTGEVYIAGRTSSTNFPRTSGGAQGKYGDGPQDAFVASLTANLAAGRSSGSGSSMIASASSTASFWNILLLLSVPAFVLARRIRKR
jgi:muconolactone delta-isomerase